MDLQKITQSLQVQAREDSKPIETIDLNLVRAESALTTSNQIRDCTEQELKDKLTLIFSMVGLRPHNYPSGNEKTDLHNYIVYKFGHKTLSEFVLAFDLAINQELDIKTEDVKVYDQFTIAYVALIMTAYKKWLHNTFKNRKSKVEVVESKVEEVSDEEVQEMIDRWIEKDKMELLMIPDFFYSFLEKQGEINPTPKAKWEYLEKAVVKVKSMLLDDMESCKTTDAMMAFRKFEDMEKDGFTGDFKTRILNLSMRMIVYDYFTSKKKKSQ